jgi:hypothetical protein
MYKAIKKPTSGLSFLGLDQEKEAIGMSAVNTLDLNHCYTFHSLLHRAGSRFQSPHAGQIK